MINLGEDTKKEITTWTAIQTIVQNLGLKGTLSLAPWVLVAYLYFNGSLIPGPAPSPAPGPTPATKTLRDLVSPEAAVELGDLYHAIALQLNSDGLRLDSKDEKPVINTVGDFYNMSRLSMQSFQNMNNITGIAAINEPISAKLKRATGTMKPAASIDDPATKIRASLVAITKDISEEFNPDMAQVPLSTVR